ncbi:hypothetical protein [Halorussus sp. MSC15.2]|uniref:hypothetical protein n=1 Tax=Halorussus sp. MSC15.2 TaxID=2283638 RepID=UPI0013D8D91D|nr:hypothetical protein [Halorussus sp. MSC15.2]NEU58551.1 hypothetical protein [Halorussus sp. MSC15.2]
MFDSDGDDSPVEATARSALAVALVGGFQWAITGAYVFLLGFLAVVWYLRTTRTAMSLDLSWAFAGFVVAAFLAGALWVRARSPAPGTTDSQDAHDRRIEVVVTMLVLGFLLPFGVPRLLDLFGATPSEPILGFGLAYVLALALSYGLVYGLGVRPFLGPGRSDDRTSGSDAALITPVRPRPTACRSARASRSRSRTASVNSLPRWPDTRTVPQRFNTSRSDRQVADVLLADCSPGWRSPRSCHRSGRESERVTRGHPIT